jgi:hypothetical protein
VGMGRQTPRGERRRGGSQPQHRARRAHGGGRGHRARVPRAHERARTDVTTRHLV